LPGLFRQSRILAEQPLGFRLRKPRQPRRLEIGGALVGGLDLLCQFLRQHRRQAEADVDGGEQAVLDHLVGAADHGLERRDHVANDVFRRVVQQRREPYAIVDTRRLLAQHRFHQ
jgi:hypothetical protein